MEPVFDSWTTIKMISTESLWHVKSIHNQHDLIESVPKEVYIHKTNTLYSLQQINTHLIDDTILYSIMLKPLISKNNKSCSNPGWSVDFFHWLSFMFCVVESLKKNKNLSCYVFTHMFELLFSNNKSAWSPGLIRTSITTLISLNK